MPAHRAALLAIVLTTLGGVGCGSEGFVDGAAATSDSGGSSSTALPSGAADTTSSSTGSETSAIASTGNSAAATTGEASSSEDTTDSTGGDPPRPPARCGDDPPAGATLAPVLPNYGGVCPVLEPGLTNVIDTSGGAREFIFIVPSDLGDDEVLPVIVMYHWLGADAESFVEVAQVQAAADWYRFAALLPQGRSIEQLVPFQWPFAISDLDIVMEQDFDLFDAMLACVAEQYAVDKECVSAMGVSAGAMFTSMLASRHGDGLASFLSLSGGVGGLVKPWEQGSHRMPALVLWGGRMDFCIAIDFAVGSQQLEDDLMADDHAIVECIHNCTHATPPFDPPADDPEAPVYGAVWDFVLAHPYWLPDGDSPYDGLLELPSPWPEWCAGGAGLAVERVGECMGSECQ